MNPKLEEFMKIYEEELRKVITKAPMLYGYPVEDVPRVMARMKVAIENRTFNKDSPSIKTTCKKLNIKHTYKAIKEFIDSGKSDTQKAAEKGFNG